MYQRTPHCNTVKLTIGAQKTAVSIDFCRFTFSGTQYFRNYNYY